MPKPEERVYEGLAQVAHAIRRSTALTVAMQIVPEHSTVEEMLEQADELAQWIGGKALEQTPGPRPRSAPLGEPFNP